MKTKVTGDASLIVSGLLSWMNDPTASKHCTVTGGAGAGKTHMIKQLCDSHAMFNQLGIGAATIPFEVVSTTHDSVEVLSRFLNSSTAVKKYRRVDINPSTAMAIPIKPREIRTIYSLLGLVPSKGIIHKRVGGNKKLNVNQSKQGIKDKAYDPYLTEQFIVCDESNYTTQDTLDLIDIWWPNTRIIFIGSQHQLGASSGQSVIFNQGWDNFFLNTKFRSKNTDVQAVYDSTEEDVINGGAVRDILNNPTVVYLRKQEWLATLKNAYTADTKLNVVTLAYTNERVFELVGMIRYMQGRPGFFDAGGYTQALRAGSSKIRKKGVNTLRDENGMLYVPVQSQKKILRSYAAESYEHFKYLSSKHHQRIPDEIYPSLLASTEAMTIHGAQGGTWDYVFVDLPNINTAKRYDPETYRRLRHVAMTRQTTMLFILID